MVDNIFFNKLSSFHFFFFQKFLKYLKNRKRNKWYFETKNSSEIISYVFTQFINFKYFLKINKFSQESKHFEYILKYTLNVFIFIFSNNTFITLLISIKMVVNVYTIFVSHMTLTSYYVPEINWRVYFRLFFFIPKLS